MKKSPVLWAIVAFILTSSPAWADVATLAMGAAITAGVAVAAGIGMLAAATATPAVAVGVGVAVLGVGLLGLTGVGLDSSDPNSATNPANASTIKANLTPNTPEQDAALADKQNAYNSGGYAKSATGELSVDINGTKVTVADIEATAAANQNFQSWGYSAFASFPNPMCVSDYAKAECRITCDAAVQAGNPGNCWANIVNALNYPDIWSYPFGKNCPSGTTESGSNCLPQYDATKPSTQTTSDNKFQPDPTNVPPGGAWVKQPDGSWDYYGPNGEWGSITPDGKTLSMYGEDGNGNIKGTQVTTYTDGSKNISTAVSLPVSDPQGNVSYVPGVVTTSITSGGTKSTTTVQTGPNVDPNTTSLTPGAGGDGQTLTGQTGTLTGGTGTGTGTGTDPGTGTGNCGAGDCATETTQLANKSLLQKIADAFSNGGDPNEVTGPTDGEIEGAFFGGTFSELLGWNVPAHGSECPVLSINWSIAGSSQVIETDAYCQVFDQNRDVLSAVLLAIYSFSALIIVLRA